MPDTIESRRRRHAHKQTSSWLWGLLTLLLAVLVVLLLLLKGCSKKHVDVEDEDDGFYLECPDADHPHLIDMGLPNGTLWACCNVGASKPSDYGSYFAWGETQAKAEYSWETYRYSDGTNEGTTNIGGDIAGTAYDAATANWGSDWRMPTWEQFEELTKNTTVEWTVKNGVKGMTFTGSNGGAIFLPAGNSQWRKSENPIGDRGCYWSSTAWKDYSSRGLYVTPNPTPRTTPYFTFRGGGLTIRPVSTRNNH